MKMMETETKIKLPELIRDFPPLVDPIPPMPMIPVVPETPGTAPVAPVTVPEPAKK